MVKLLEFRRANHYAVLGFCLPFVAAAFTCLLMLIGEGDFSETRFVFCYLTVIPSVLLFGLFLSFKSISYIQKKGDRDYVYAGLTLNVLSLLLYISSLICFFPFRTE